MVYRRKDNMISPRKLVKFGDHLVKSHSKTEISCFFNEGVESTQKNNWTDYLRRENDSRGSHRGHREGSEFPYVIRNKNESYKLKPR